MAIVPTDSLDAAWRSPGKQLTPRTRTATIEQQRSTCSSFKAHLARVIPGIHSEPELGTSLSIKILGSLVKSTLPFIAEMLHVPRAYMASVRGGDEAVRRRMRLSMMTLR